MLNCSQPAHDYITGQQTTFHLKSFITYMEYILSTSFAAQVFEIERSHVLFDPEVSQRVGCQYQSDYKIRQN